MQAVLIVLAIAFALSLIPAVIVFVRTCARFEGTRLTDCPIAKRSAKVRLDAVHAAWSSLTGEPDLRVASCSEWPARKDCTADCLIRLEVSPPRKPPRKSLA